MRAVAVLLSLTTLTACNAILGIEDLSGPDGGGGGGDDAPPGPSTVNGTAIDLHYASPTGITEVPEDLSGYTIQAYSPDDSAAGFQIIDGVGHADGTFTIPDVPAGSYLLYLTSQDSPLPHFYETSSRTPEIGVVTRGRTDGSRATASTVLTFHLTGMSPFEFGDKLSIHSLSTGVVQTVPDLALDATALDHTLDWNALQAPLLDSTRGDDLYVLHERRTVLSPLSSVTTIVDAYTTDDVTLADGAPASVNGTFAAPATSASQRIYLSPSAYLDGLDIENHLPLFMTVQLRAGFTPGLIEGQPLLALSRQYNQVVDGASQHDVTYRDPYPSSFTHYTNEHVSYGWPFAARGTTSVVTFYTDAYAWRTAVSPMSTSPQSAPPRSIEVNGVDARAAAAVPFDGSAPVTVTWTAVTGVSHYIVFVLRLSESGGSGTSSAVAFADTSTNSMTLPASLFSEGDTYFMSVSAAGGDQYADGVLRRFWPGQSLREAPTARLVFSSTCGNGTPDAAYEECDTSGVATSACNADCTTPRCGDAIHNAAAGEACDDGGDSVYCTKTCELSSCGDGYVNSVAGEGCDDDDLDDGDGCGSLCNVEGGYVCTGSPSVCTVL